MGKNGGIQFSRRDDDRRARPERNQAYALLEAGPTQRTHIMTTDQDEVRLAMQAPIDTASVTS